MRKILAVFMLFVFCFTCIQPRVSARAAEYKISLVDESMRVMQGKPGTVISARIPVRASDYLSRPIVTASVGADSPISVGAISLAKDNMQTPPESITFYDTTYLEFAISIKDTAKIGNYEINLNFEFEVYTDEGSEPANSSLKLVVYVGSEKAPAQLVIDKVEYSADDAVVGNTFDVKFTIKNEGEITALNSYFSIDFGSTGLSPAYTVDGKRLGDLKGGEKATVTLPFTVLPTAEEGFKTLVGNFTYKDGDGISGSDSKNIFITVQKVSTASSENAKLIISSRSYQEDVNAGEKFELKAVLENVGEETASKVRVSLIGGVGTATGILPDFNTADIEVRNISKGGVQEVSLPLIIADTAPEGLQEITLQVSYMGGDNISRTAVAKIYLMVRQEKEEDGKVNRLDFSSVSQKPAAPTVGGRVTVSFTVINSGNGDVSDIRLWGEGLSSSNFEPLNSEPYQKAGNLAAGQKKQVSMTFYVGENIAEGLNTLKIGYSYEDEEKKQQLGSVSFHILDIKNDKNDSSSKPKLIITEFGVDQDQIRAGSTFTFYYDIKNTHASKAAKNIKVTVSSANDVFSATQGSNTFYIDKIDAGQIQRNELQMKAKSDLATGGYELEIEVEYEYDNMSAIDLEKGGVTDKNTLKLQAVENARPMVANVSVYGYMGMPTVNQSANISFNFFNMGRSTLSNVYFTLSGDFMFESGSMQYYTSAPAGSNEYLDYSVIPLREGICAGTITVHFEDSNGDEVTKDFEFSDIFVQGEASYEPMPDPGFPVDGGVIAAPKKPLLKLWLFVLIQAAVIAIVVPVTRAIGIKLYKRKLMKREDEAV